MILNPWQPRDVSIKGLPGYIPAGGTLDLSDYVALEPDYAVTTLSFKCSGAGKLDKGTSRLRATKAGKAKITVTTANKLKATCTLEVRANEAQYAYGKPAAGDIAAVSGGWTLWPVSVEPAKKGGLLCQFQLLNGTGEKATKIENLTLSIAAGTRDNIIAECKGQTVKASVGKGKAKLIKMNLPTKHAFNGVFLPTSELFFSINQDAVHLEGKNQSYEFVYTPKFPAPINLVQSITLDPAEITLKVGETQAIVPTVLPADAANKTLTWTSSNEAVAKVGGSTVTAIGEGNATITAAAADGSNVKATCAVTVIPVPQPETPVQSITLDPDEVMLKVGETQAIAHTVLPDNATNKTLTWTSNNEAVAKVDGGTVTAIGEGNATITATAADGSGVKATCAVTVVPLVIKVQSITLNPTSVTLKVGEAQAITHTVLPENATNKTLTWTSNNEAVAKVDSGTVTAIGEGSATITATATDGSNTSAVCLVTVNDPEVIPETPIKDFTFEVLNGTYCAVTGYTGTENRIKLPKHDNEGHIVQIIADNAFSNMNGLVWVVVEDTVVKIGDEAFLGCTGITTITLPGSLEEIGAHAFENCVELKSIHIPDSVKIIGTNAFENCAELSSASYPLHLESAAWQWPYQSPFINCPKLTEIVVPEGVTVIPSNTFREMTSLQGITLPSTLKTIGDEAFSGCSDLLNVYIGKDVDYIADNAFDNHNANLTI